MDVDDAAWIGVDEMGREHLHVAGENDEVDRVLGEKRELRGFDRELGGGRDGHEVEWDAVELGERAGVLVVADDHCEIAAELAGLVALQQVG